MVELKEWGCLMDTTDRVPMKEATCLAMINLTGGEMQAKAGDSRYLDALDKELVNKSLAYQILRSRLEAVESPVELAPSMLVASICRSPGEAVMWAFTLNKIACETGKPVDLAALVQRFPHGLPSEKAYSDTWDAQKEPGAPLGNAIDRMDEWPRYYTETTEEEK